MNTQGQPPVVLRIVAASFLFGAGLAAIAIGIGLMQAHLELASSLLGFWIAPGLLRRDPTWRRWGVALSVLQLLGAVAGAALMVSGPPGPVRVLGIPLAHAPSWLFPVVAVSGSLVAAWQWWALTRPATREWFARHAGAAGPAAEFPT